LILLAKSEIHAMHVWQAVENPVCLRAGPCDNDFASSITFGEMGSFGGLVPFSCPQEGKKNRVIAEGGSLHLPR
jgi:hypothetical protein